MGMYIYRITAEKVDTPLGLANRIQYAYKPFYNDDAANSKMHFKSGCLAAERMTKRGTHTGLAADVDQYGTVTTVYRTGDRAWFEDYWMDKRIAWMQGETVNDATFTAEFAQACTNLAEKRPEPYRSRLLAAIELRSHDILERELEVVAKYDEEQIARQKQMA